MLERLVAGAELGVEDAARLFDPDSVPLDALVDAADTLRKAQVGDAVTYVVNRNINFTNVCVKRCSFCAFSRTFRSDEGYLLPIEEIVRRVREAVDLGATEVCLQAGLPPGWSGRDYVDVTAAVKAAVPSVHLHAWSPEEVKYGWQRSDWTLAGFLGRLRDAGLGSLPGTSAEILDDTLRRRIAPGRIRTREWVDVITTAHLLGIPTTSTMMFAHVETHAQRAAHLDLLRRLQRETHGITEFVPLSYVRETPALLAPPAIEEDILRTMAVSRLFLGRDIPHLQASWVKEGLARSAKLLACGADDLGGTLINESISTAAGASHGQLMRPSTLRATIVAAGRVPSERTTLYARLPGREIPLDTVTDPARFGSYSELVASPAWRFASKPRAAESRVRASDSRLETPDSRHVCEREIAGDIDVDRELGERHASAPEPA